MVYRNAKREGFSDIINNNDWFILMAHTSFQVRHNLIKSWHNDLSFSLIGVKNIKYCKCYHLKYILGELNFTVH